MNLLIALFAWIQTRLNVSLARPSTRLANPAAARAAGFVEYAMLAAIAIAIYFVFKGPLTNAFQTILNQINSVLGNDGAGG